MRYPGLRSLFPVLCVAALLTACSGGGDTTNVTNVNNVVSPVAVSSVFPAEARIGETITVHGQNFGASQGTSTLKISGVAATQIWSWMDTQIVATVPTGAGTGNVTVAVNGVDGAPGHLVVPWEAQNPDNVAITTTDATGQRYPLPVPDGAGGAIIVYQTNFGDIYAQRVSSGGVVQWAAEGVAITTTASSSLVRVVSDSAGGVIITWRDNRTVSNNNDIYAQRINGAGVVQWTVNGVAICNTADAQDNPDIAADGAGGAIIAWQDGRNGVDWEIYAQRINQAGLVQWTATVHRLRWRLKTRKCRNSFRMTPAGRL